MKSCWPRLYQVESHSVMMVEIIANILFIELNQNTYHLSRKSLIPLEMMFFPRSLSTTDSSKI